MLYTTHTNPLLTIIGIFLVAGLGKDVIFNALFTERVHAVEALGVAEVFETNLTHKKLVVNLLCKTDSVLAARQCSEVFVVVDDVVVRRRGYGLSEVIAAAFRSFVNRYRVFAHRLL